MVDGLYGGFRRKQSNAGDVKDLFFYSSSRHGVQVNATLRSNAMVL